MRKKTIKSSRFHLFMPDWLLSEVRESAAAKGISTCDYLRDIIKIHQFGIHINEKKPDNSTSDK